MRNLLRRRGRTLVIAGLLAVAVVFFLFMESLMTGMMDVSFGNVIDYETPHIEIGREEFFARAGDEQGLPPAETFLPGEDVLTAIRAREGFVALTPVLDFSAVLAATGYEFPVRVRSVDPDTFGDVFRNQEHLLEGSFVEPNGPGLVIGSRLADVFDLEVGDLCTLLLQDDQGSLITVQGSIRGILSVPHPDMNLGTVFMGRDRAAELLGIEEGRVSHIMVRMESRDQALTEAEELADQLAGYDLAVRSYRDASELLVSLEAWGYLETYVILALFLLVGAIGITSAIVLGAIERVREIGMMKALGLRESEIVRVFLIEAGGIGAIGGLIGCALGAGVVYWLSNYGISMEAFLDLEALGVPMGDHIYGAWTTSSFAMILVFVTLVAVAASVLPAYWAARKDPVEAIQHR